MPYMKPVICGNQSPTNHTWEKMRCKIHVNRVFFFPLSLAHMGSSDCRVFLCSTVESLPYNKMHLEATVVVWHNLNKVKFNEIENNSKGLKINE